MRGGKERHLRNLPAGSGHVTRQPVLPPQQVVHQRGPHAHRGEDGRDHQQKASHWSHLLLHRAQSQRG